MLKIGYFRPAANRMQQQANEQLPLDFDTYLQVNFILVLFALDVHLPETSLFL